MTREGPPASPTGVPMALGAVLTSSIAEATPAKPSPRSRPRRPHTTERWASCDEESEFPTTIRDGTDALRAGTWPGRAIWEVDSGLVPTRPSDLSAADSRFAGGRENGMHWRNVGFARHFLEQLFDAAEPRSAPGKFLERPAVGDQDVDGGAVGDNVDAQRPDDREFLVDDVVRCEPRRVVAAPCAASSGTPVASSTSAWAARLTGSTSPA